MSLRARYAQVMGQAFAEDEVLRVPGAVRLSDDGLAVARGDSFLDDDDAGAAEVASPLSGVDGAAWTQFVRALATAEPGTVSSSNALGMFQMMPRRLADLGLVKRLKRVSVPGQKGKAIYVAAFVPPLSAERFLASPRLQYEVFVQSVAEYDAQLAAGTLKRDPAMSRAGALALLHRCGPQALETWATGERFPQTEVLFRRTEGLF